MRGWYLHLIFSYCSTESLAVLACQLEGLILIAYFCEGHVILWDRNNFMWFSSLCLHLFCTQGWELNNLTSVIHFSFGVSFNYSLLVLLVIPITPCWLLITHNSRLSKPKYLLFIFCLIALFIIQPPPPIFTSISLDASVLSGRAEPSVLVSM